MEVKAVLSFQQYQAGKIYAVDVVDPYYAALIKAGYLKVISTLMEVTDELGTDSDCGRLDSVPVAGVAKKRGRPKKAVNSGEGEHFSATGEHVFVAENDAAGTPDSEPDSPRGSEVSA